MAMAEEITLKRMKEFMPSSVIEWIESIGVQENEPIALNFQRDILRDHEREAREGLQWKCHKPGPGVNLSLITSQSQYARTAHFKRFLISDGIWTPQEEKTDGIDWLRDLPPYKSTSEAITAMQKAIQNERTQDEYEHDIMPRDEVLAGLLECVAYELLPSGKDRENILAVLDMYCGKPVEEAK